MAVMDNAALEAAFKAHTAGSSVFSRRMAVALSDMDGSTPLAVTERLERIGLLKPGSADWFRMNGGITRQQVAVLCSTRHHGKGPRVSNGETGGATSTLEGGG